MGREASCECTWGSETALSKVLLESRELIVRGVIRRKALISSLREVRVEGDQLTFLAGDEKVCLALGGGVADKWAKAIATPSPSLAKKLGFSGSTQLLVVGEIVDGDLKAAVAEACTLVRKNPSLVLACVRTADELRIAVDRCTDSTLKGCPAWIVYPKGTGKKEVEEAAVREAFRSRGFIDTKVTSVSATLTATRFHRRRS
jgi:hypothetical protein